MSKFSQPLEHKAQIFQIFIKVGARGGGEFFHSKGTWGCAARRGILLLRDWSGLLLFSGQRVRGKSQLGCLLTSDERTLHLTIEDKFALTNEVAEY